MARPPAGPIGNSPRDVRDDAVGVPADDIKAPEPPRWPRKPKRVTTNTFHAKVSGDASVKRADRKPHFRRGGFVRGFASGGNVWSNAEERREEKPGEDKNDPFAKQNLRGGGNVKKKLADGGGVKKRQEGGSIGAGLQAARDRGVVEARKIMRGAPQRSESTENARALSRADQDLTNRAAGGRGMPREESEGILRTFKETGEYKRGGGVLSAAQRQAMPKSDFALPGKGEGPKGAGSGSYPINNPSHAKNALARASGKPVEAKVRAAVHRKYPGIGQK